MYLQTLSGSRSDIIDQCLLKYDYKYIRKIPGFPVELQNSAVTMEETLDFGTYIHKIFELGYKEGNQDELLKLAESIKGDYKLPGIYKDRIEKCVNNFYKFNRNLGETVAVEHHFKVQLAEGIDYTGYIDRIVRGTKGGILIIDYKTSKREKTRIDLARNNQLLGYTYAIHKEMGIPISQITCGHYYPVTDHFVDIRYSPIDIQQWVKREVSKVWKIRKMRKDEFRPKQNEFCDFCEFKPICTKFNDECTVNLRIEEQLRNQAGDNALNEGESPRTKGR